MLSAHELTARYGSIVAVRGASVVFEAGTLTALVGPNGAGKTSLFSALAGIVEATGDVSVDGERVDHLVTEERAARGLAFVPAARRLFGALTVRQNLVVGATVLPRSRARAAVQEVLDRFPLLDERSEQRADTLSGGEGQILMIARALVASPRALLVDEPFQGLSDEAAQVVLGTLRAAAQAGAAVAIASPVEVDGVDAIAIKHGSLEVWV